MAATTFNSSEQKVRSTSTCCRSNNPGSGTLPWAQRNYSLL